MTSIETRIATARGLLADQPETPGRPMAALGAALLAATASVAMAGVIVLGPGFEIDETPYVANAG